MSSVGKGQIPSKGTVACGKNHVMDCRIIVCPTKKMPSRKSNMKHASDILSYLLSVENNRFGMILVYN